MIPVDILLKNRFMVPTVSTTEKRTSCRKEKMYKGKILMFYKKFITILFILFHSNAFAMDESEYFILFRGYHFSNSQPKSVKKEELSKINKTGQTVCSHYASSEDFQISNKDEKALKFFDKLRENRPYSSRKEVVYPSAYHWMMEHYVNDYAKFMEDLSDSSSELVDDILKEYKLKFDKNFLVSTTLKISTAVKYASGYTMPENIRKWPNWGPKDKGESSTLGFVDVFFIPYQDLKNLRAFPVVEEFALHSINIPYKFMQTNYTLAEEYIFPFFIPSQYHKKRIPIKLEKLRKSPIPKTPNSISLKPAKEVDFMKKFVKGQIAPMTKKVHETVEELSSQEQGERIFLYLLRYRMDNKDQSKLTPLNSVELHTKSHDLMIKSKKEIASQGASTYEQLTLPESIAIERTFDSFGEDDFFIECTKHVNLNMGHLAALANHENLKKVTIGRKKGELEIALRCLGMGWGKYQKIPNFEPLIVIGLQRTDPIIFKMALILDPNIKHKFQSIEQKTGNKIQFKFDSQSAIAQEHEKDDYEWVKRRETNDNQSNDELMEFMCPNISNIKNIQKEFVEGLQKLSILEELNDIEDFEEFKEYFDNEIYFDHKLEEIEDITDPEKLIIFIKKVKSYIEGTLEEEINDALEMIYYEHEDPDMLSKAEQIFNEAENSYNCELETIVDDVIDKCIKLNIFEYSSEDDESGSYSMSVVPNHEVIIQKRERHEDVTDDSGRKKKRVKSL